VRRTTTRTVARLRDLRGAEGRQPGTVETFVYTYKSALRGGVLALGVLVYVLASHPTALWTLVLVAVLGVALLVIEFLARPPVPA
jgi:ABC-type multidrug transport system permease subunit